MTAVVWLNSFISSTICVLATLMHDPAAHASGMVFPGDMLLEVWWQSPAL